MVKKTFLVLLILASPLITRAASLSLGPSTGTFTVGSTFDVSVFIDSNNQSVNAVGAFLQFPPDKLQLVSPSVGKSIVDVWVTAPQFNNTLGQVSLEGVVPGGLKTNNGLLTTLTFRVKSVGQAVVKFLNQSKVLLNDGVGSDALDRVQGGIYQLVLPPPAGPLVVSETHPDQTRWYPNNNLVLTWATEGSEVKGYSYVLNDEPIDIPDDVSEGLRSGVGYKSLSEGRQYFHIKALRGGVWGETTHFAVLIDKTAPANFQIEILPAARTTGLRPVIQFSTTDNSSGLDHYELKLVSLRPGPEGEDGVGQPLFIETGSPYVPQTLALGDYDVIVRAYDVAGNYQEVTKRLSIVTPLFRLFSDEGLMIRDFGLVPWPLVLGFIVLLILVLAYLATHLRSLHFSLHRRRWPLPDHIQEQLSELQKYRDRYGKALVIIFLLGSLLASSSQVQAAETDTLSPPVVTTSSRHISNKDIFYLGGRVDNTDSEVIIYLKNPATSELFSFRVQPDHEGNWFYRHNTFLAAGNYFLWTQARYDKEFSPPGPELGLVVAAQAFQFGASRLSYDVVFLIIIVVLGGALIALLIDVGIHWRRIKRKQTLLREEIKQAEEAVQRGFAILRRDIQSELQAVREQSTRDKLLDDLQKVEKFIGKEIVDVEKVEYTN
ncbi:hypothetical protein IT398_00840 [Candidatus Nomurabacteria bacterium]|nr:hypothetical protein [Candidatus Nomurabacteria bacterium]